MLIKEIVQPEKIRNTFCLKAPARIVIQHFIILEMSDGLKGGGVCEEMDLPIQAGKRFHGMGEGNIIRVHIIYYSIQ